MTDSNPDPTAFELVVAHSEGDVTVRQIASLLNISTERAYELVTAVYRAHADLADDDSSPVTVTPNRVSDDLDEEAKQVIADTVAMGGSVLTGPPKGQTCERDGCEEDAVRGIGDEWLCREHQDEFFAAWHG